jgi:hypothetical protein
MILLGESINTLLSEGGIRNIKELSQRYDKAKIYYHIDLDGVTSAIGMKNYLERNGIKVVDTEVIQYGEQEFSVKKPSARGDIMPVLVDFAHGKPMFVIHTDHHDTQVGVEKGTSKSFRHARSNVETISQILPSSDIFPSDDVKMISTVDSADFVNMDINPDQIMNYIFSLDRTKSDRAINTVSKNKKAMALVTNKLILAYKNKPKFLDRVVMEATPSLINIYQTVVKLAKESGFAPPEVLQQNLNAYIERQKNNEKVKYFPNEKIIVQNGGGDMFKPGSYDRYVPFKNYPEADFLLIVWPMGLIQASCNPFKKERALKGINLGQIKDEVLNEFRSELEEHLITVSSIKFFSESNKHFTEESVGFTWTDLMALYQDTQGGITGISELPEGAPTDYTLERWRAALEKIMDTPYNKLNDKQIRALELLKITGWDVINANSGGHKCITNVSGLSYFGKDSVNPAGKQFTTRIAKEFFNKLRDRIKVG